MFRLDRFEYLDDKILFSDNFIFGNCPPYTFTGT